VRNKFAASDATKVLRGQIRSAYSYYNAGTDVESRYPEYTNYTVKFKGTLDHLFYNADHVKLLKLLEMPSHDDVKKQEAIPSNLFPSDHLRMEAKFAI